MVTEVNYLENLTQGTQALGLNLPEPVHQQLLTYVHLLAKWSRVYNLTAIREVEQMIPRHVLDCLTVLPYLRGTRILDVGSGAGLPGLILAMVCPQQQWVLLDGNAKKTRFIQQAAFVLQLKNVEVIHVKIERFQSPHLFDTIICRAFASLRVFYHQTIKWCAPTGCLLAMKGIYPQAELAEMSGINVQIESIPLKVPQLQAERHLVILQRPSDPPV